MSLSKRRRGVRRGRSWGWDDIEVLLRRDSFTPSAGETVFRGDAWFLPTVGTHVYDGWLYVAERYYGYGYQRWEWSEVCSWDPDEDRAYHLAAYSNLQRARVERGEVGMVEVEEPSDDPIEARRGITHTYWVRDQYDPDAVNEIDYVISKEQMPLEYAKWWWDEGPEVHTTYRGAWANNRYALPFAWENPDLYGSCLAIVGPEKYNGPEQPNNYYDDDEIPF